MEKKLIFFFYFDGRGVSTKMRMEVRRGRRTFKSVLPPPSGVSLVPQNWPLPAPRATPGAATEEEEQESRRGRTRTETRSSRRSGQRDLKHCGQLFGI